MKKKIFAVLTATILLCACLPLSVSAEKSGTTGDCTWTLDDSGHLTISGNGEMGDYSSEYTNGEYRTTAPWGGNITSVTIEDGVTTIGNYAFYQCHFLTSVTMDDSVTTIGDEAFAYCNSLTSVTIPDSVTTIGNSAFDSCGSLQSVTIGNRVTTIGKYAFYDCGCLRVVTIPDIATTIGYRAFDECADLQSVYYTGTEEDYANMVIQDDNSYLLDATWHYEYGKEESKNDTEDRLFDTEDRLSAKEGFDWWNVVEVVLLIVIIVLLFLLLKKKKA